MRELVLQVIEPMCIEKTRVFHPEFPRQGVHLRHKEGRGVSVCCAAPKFAPDMNRECFRRLVVTL